MRACPGHHWRGDLRIVTAADARRATGCRRIGGDLVVEGAAIVGLEHLSELTEVAGSVRIGPTLRVASVRGLHRLARIGGDLDLTSNLGLTGAFFPALLSVGGNVVVNSNRELTTLSVHAVTTVGGDVVVSDNSSLWRADFTALRTVGGHVDVDGSPRLEMLVLDPALHP